MAKKYVEMKLEPKNKNQQDFIRSVYDNTITIVIGPAGVGKSFISVALAYKLFKSGDIKKIIITRPTVETLGIKGKTIGSLPGDVMEKMAPYMRPIYDELQHFVSKAEIDEMFKLGYLEVVPLEFMRGRNFHDAFIIADESQNIVSTELDMLITRLGMNSKMVLNGDITQSDLPEYLQGALEDYIEALQNCEHVGVVEFSNKDIVRNPIIGNIISMIRRYRQTLDEE